MTTIDGSGVALVTVFSALVGLSAALGLAWAAWQAPRSQALVMVNAGIWSLVGALIGGRGAYVVLNWGYFHEHWIETLQVFLGGLSWPGALLGGILGLAIYAFLAHQPLGLLADGLLPFAGLLAISSWLGCWVDGCAYGPLSGAWWAAPARDEWGTLALRFPTQLLGALLTLGLLWFLEGVVRSGSLHTAFPHPGQAASLGLLGFGLILFGLSFVRDDPSPMLWGMRMEAWAALGFAVIAGVALLIFTVSDRS